MSPGVRGGAGRRGAEAPIDQVQGQANRIRPGKGCAGVLEVRPWRLREMVSRAAGPGWCLLLHVATCCCTLVPVVARCYLLLRVAEARELVRCLIDA